MLCCMASLRTPCPCVRPHGAACLTQRTSGTECAGANVNVTILILLAAREEKSFQSPSIQNYPQLLQERWQHRFLFFLDAPRFCTVQRYVWSHLFDFPALINNQNVNNLQYMCFAICLIFFCFIIWLLLSCIRRHLPFFLRHQTDLLYERQWSVADVG